MHQDQTQRLVPGPDLVNQRTCGHRIGAALDLSGRVGTCALDPTPWALPL